MIKSGDIIKHNAFMDIAVQVFFINNNPETEEIEISGVWVNQGQVNTYCINEPAKFTIKKHELSNWMKCLKPKSDLIRIEQWEKLT